MKTPLFCILMLLTVLLSCNNNQKEINSPNNQWHLVFKNDEKGKTVFGDKLQLIDAVRLGYPIRIGWGGMRVEHIANADFLTIFQGKEVFAQINTIVGQEPRIKNDSLKIRLRMNNHWTKIAGTNGYTYSFMTDYLKDSIVGGGKDRYTATSWYVFMPEKTPSITPQPLWRKESKNWKDWRKNE